ncbi:phage integrase SAM-like domain and Arm DNA-binding domain-containing protein, partial [Butyricimonas virosa]|uniref:phage integrase SAM-like domain and Arm DNA-binding domain-containing protein n=2 Tax=Butyricimonas TaxID=574697 RepID=UPI0022E2B9D3
MNASISIIYYKFRTNKSGAHPLMLRIIKNRKTNYQSLGIYIHPDHWDFKKNKPKKNCPNGIAIQRLITEKIKEYTDKAIDLEIEKKDFTGKTLIDKVNTPVKRMNVNDLFLQEIAQLKKEGRIRYAECHDYVYKSLLKFNKHLDIYFSEIDVQWLRRYETWLRGEGNSENTIGIKFRTLRTMYNIAIREGYVKAEFYPFKDYKVSKLHENTPKRA